MAVTLNDKSLPNSEPEQQDSYADILRSSAWLRTIPFEHTFRNVPHEAFVQRLLQERALFEAGALSSYPLLTIVIYSNEDGATFDRTFESCILQSALHFNILIVAAAPETLSAMARQVQERLRRAPFQEKAFESRIFYCESLAAVKTRLVLGDYLVCAKAGDVFHPSFVTSFYLELYNSSPPADLYVCNEMIVDFGAVPAVRKFVRKPNLELWTLFHTNYVSYSFVVRSSVVVSFPDFDFYLERNDAHLFLLSALKEATNRYGHIPQYLFLRDSAHVRDNRELVQPHLQSYREYLEAFSLTLDLIDGPTLYRLTPKKKPTAITVIIAFRDKPELTCRTLGSVFDQKMDALLEIILVNNQSCPESIEYINGFVEARRSKEKIVRFLNYDLPFNHSAECNLGAREAGGECLIFLNNDVELISTDALMQMASWSLFSGIGTVGIRMRSMKNGTRASAGIALRLTSGADYNSITEERNADEFGHYNRETWGNTFACAAISRRTFNLIGALDEVNFPNGYNDVDYSMRCRKAGLRNIYLGTVCAVHDPGTSRGRCDELYQKILLRKKYPESFRDSLFQLEVENRNPANTTAPPQKGENKGRFYRTLRKFGL